MKTLKKLKEDQMKDSRFSKEYLAIQPELNAIRYMLDNEGKQNDKIGFYHQLQIDFTYHSNRIEGNRLTLEQVRSIHNTNTICTNNSIVFVDDLIETVNHFRCIDEIIRYADDTLTESFIKHLHDILKTGTSDASNEWFMVGEYKTIPNEVGIMQTTHPKDVKKEMKKLLRDYNQIDHKTLHDLLDFHVKFERIHPFQDGNGRVGRLIMFKECLKYNIVPFIIEEDLKMFYYRGLKEWSREEGYLMDTCLTAQDRMIAHLEYLKIDNE